MTWGSVFNATLGQYEVSTSIVDKIGGTPQGENVKRMPEGGWSSSSLGALMSTTRIYTDLGGTIEVLRSKSLSKMSSMTRTAIIASVTVSTIVALALAIWLVFRRKARSIDGTIDCPADESKRSSASEIDEKAKYELRATERQVYEMSGEEWRYEAADTLVRAEADSANIALPQAAELPATNVSTAGRWGIPLIVTEAASKRESAVPKAQAAREVPGEKKSAHVCVDIT
jgi:hypothetical protein